MMRVIRAEFIIHGSECAPLGYLTAYFVKLTLWCMQPAKAIVLSFVATIVTFTRRPLTRCAHVCRSARTRSTLSERRTLNIKPIRVLLTHARVLIASVT
jgi:hypothetical protein